MDPALEIKLRDMVDRDEIWRVMQRYGRGVDRCDRELLLSCYWDDAIEDHGSFIGTPADFVDYAFGSTRGCKTSIHSVLNHSCELDGDEAHVETYYLFVSTADKAPHLASFGRYVDHFRKRNGEWRIANRICSIEGVFGLEDHPFATAHVATHYPPGEEPYRHDRQDVSYQRPVRPRPIPARQMG